MSSRAPINWIVDPDDPRAPPLDVWHSMSTEERERVIASLPSEFDPSESAPPEGDLHFNAKMNARKTLGRFFDRAGRRVYLACELPIYYPGERMFAPDVMAVLDVELHERDHWVVAKEGKGLDFALEIFVSGSRRKDHELNVERYARLGITEYFIFDRGRLRLSGYRLPSAGAGSYEPIMPQHGRYESRVLGLELVLGGDKLRFFLGDAEIPEAEELIGKLEGMLNQLELKLADAERRAEEGARRAEEEARRAGEEARRAGEEARRAEEEARARADVEDRLAAALRELEALKKRSER